MRTISILLIALTLTGCSTLRDRLASVIETEERATKPDRVRIETQYVTVPTEFTDQSACPPPIQLTPQEIARITTEGEYNEYFVAPLYANNETCYLNMERIRRYNDSIEERQTDDEEEVRSDQGG